MKILITGSLGHIGSKLIHSLRKGMYEEVQLIDNMATQRYSSLFNLPKDVNFMFYEDDICNIDLNKRFKGIDVVIHLAALTDAESSFDRQELVRSVNVNGTEKIAEACMSNGCRLIFPSTTSVYGSQNEIVDENCIDDDLKPQSPYAESKLEAENFLLKMGSHEGLKLTICRFGTIFGYSIGMRFHTAVNKFIWQASQGRPITVWRTALNQKRPYLDLTDAVRVIFFIIKRDLFNNEIYNIVTSNNTVSDIIGIVNKSIPDTKVEYVDSKIMNQLSYIVSSEKIRKTGFIFRGDLTRGIGKTIKMLRNCRNM